MVIVYMKYNLIMIIITFYVEKSYMHMINNSELSIEIHTCHTHEGILMKYSIVIH